MRKTKKTSNINIFTISIAVIVVLVLLLITDSFSSTHTYVNTASGIEVIEEVEEVVQKEKSNHVKIPDQVKTIYMSACVAASPNFRADLVELVEETEVNSIIIDIKDYTGTISFDSGLDGDEGSGCRAGDMEEFVELLHEKGIYVIGRITVFQDPFYANKYPETAVKKESDGSVWEDYKGISFVEVGAEKYWDYVIDLAKISHGIGFDEINFDYIRFPSDGNMKDIYFPFSNDLIESNPEYGKAIALEEFFKYLHKEIEEYNEDREYPMITSADLFGMTTTNYDDLNIGQVLERALPYFDYVAPMVYPSHYPKNFNGWSNPNTVPYELIYFVMDSGVERVNILKNSTTTPEWIREKVRPKQLRTWIQDFDYGGDYDVAEVRAQIQATYDVGLDSWMIWAPSNIYTRGALEDE